MLLVMRSSQFDLYMYICECVNLYMYVYLNMFCDVILQQNWATGAHVNGVAVFWYVKSRPLFDSIKLKVWSGIKKYWNVENGRKIRQRANFTLEVLAAVSIDVQGVSVSLRQIQD